MLIDTGSVASLISKSSFDKLGLSADILAKVSTTLTAVDGSEMTVYGQITLKFSLSNKVFEHEFIVADIHETSGILGMGFLEKFDASIIVSISGHKIRLYKLGFTTCAHIKSSENIETE